MKAWFAIYRTLAKTHFAVMVQYRGSVFIWVLFLIVETLVYMTIWSSVAKAQGGRVSGYSPQDFAAYYLVLFWVNQITLTWVMWEYEYRVRQGALSALLLRPIHPIHFDLLENITYKLFTLVLILPVSWGFILIFEPALQPPRWALIFFIPVVLLGFALRFMLGMALAAAAFWFTRITAINRLYFMLQLFLSGQIAPVALLPDPLFLLTKYLPFIWACSFPVELLLGRVSWEQAWVGIGWQISWLGVASLLWWQLWKLGLRRYTAVGA